MISLFLVDKLRLISIPVSYFLLEHILPGYHNSYKKWVTKTRKHQPGKKIKKTPEISIYPMQGLKSNFEEKVTEQILGIICKIRINSFLINHTLFYTDVIPRKHFHHGNASPCLNWLDFGLWIEFREFRGLLFVW